jgi:hypothetical protein
MMRTFLVVLGVSAGLAACSGEEERARGKAQPVTASAVKPSRWRFVDALRSLRDREPARRLEAVEWLGKELGPTSPLAREALRAAAIDDDPEVAARARSLLERMGERLP